MLISEELFCLFFFFPLSYVCFLKILICWRRGDGPKPRNLSEKGPLYGYLQTSFRVTLYNVYLRCCLSWREADFYFCFIKSQQSMLSLFLSGRKGLYSEVSPSFALRFKLPWINWKSATNKEKKINSSTSDVEQIYLLCQKKTRDKTWWVKNIAENK